MSLPSGRIRIAVVGARRRKQGLGGFLARFFHELGAEVCGVVGSTPQSALETARSLNADLGVSAQPFSTLPELFDRLGTVDGVAICSPHSFHREHLLAAVDGGAHVLCEKPLVWDGGIDLPGETRRIAERFADRKRLLMLNTQWPYALEALRGLYPDGDLRPLRSFEMELAPLSSGLGMVPDAVPHPVSLLQALAGLGTLEGLKAEYESASGEPRLSFAGSYRHSGGMAEVALRLRRCPESPRPAAVAVNGLRIDRVIRMPEYRIGFASRDRTVWVEDPLRRRAADFLQAIRSGDGGASAADLMHHTRLLLQFHEAAAAVTDVE